MPIYEYKCNDCGKVTEEMYSNYKESSKTIHCQCGGKANRIISHYSFKVWHYDDFGDAEARAKRVGVPI